MAEKCIAMRTVCQKFASEYVEGADATNKVKEIPDRLDPTQKRLAFVRTKRKEVTDLLNLGINRAAVIDEYRV